LKNAAILGDNDFVLTVGKRTYYFASFLRVESRLEEVTSLLELVDRVAPDCQEQVLSLVSPLLIILLLEFPRPFLPAPPVLGQAPDVPQARNLNTSINSGRKKLQRQFYGRDLTERQAEMPSRTANPTQRVISASSTPNVSVSELFFDSLAAQMVERLLYLQTIRQRVLNLDEAAGYLGLSPEALRQKVLAGEVPTVDLDRRLRFDIRELDALIANKKRWAN
jgi:hypothetical protein